MSDLEQKLDGLRIDREEAPSKPLPKWIPIAAIAILLMIGVVWWLSRPQPPVVRTAVARSVEAGGRQTVLNASGYVTARLQATVSSKVTGKVTEVLIEEGMVVEADQVLARLDLSNTRVSRNLALAQRDAARAALEETRVLLHEAELDLGRARELVASQISSQAQLDRAQAQYDSLGARLETMARDEAVAQRQVAFWDQEVEDRIIRAPFAGVVVSKNAQPGEMISPVSAGGGFTRTGICTLVDMSSLEIEIDVNEAYINRVEPGQKVVATLDAYADWEIPASVIAIIPTADRQRATVQVRVGFEELDPRILPDMGVKVAFQQAADERMSQALVSIPAGALRPDGDKQVVWVVAAGAVERRAVSVERVREQEALLSAGLRSGEKVVIDPPDTLAEDDKVEEVS
jgi:RND family efflux transporter MFP subunit